MPEKELEALRRSRSAAFRREIVPYFRYVAQSGFGLAVSAVLFTLIIGYANLLRGVPADLPAGWIGAAWLTLAAVWSPLRTYLKPADPVFLLPLESAMLRYWVGPARQASTRAGALRALAAYLVFTPLYVRAPATEALASGRPLWLLGAAAAAWGVWNAWGAWRERQMVRSGARSGFRLARYAVTAASIAALAMGAPLPALVFSLCAPALLSACWRFPARQLLPWERLIAEEAGTMRRWNRFLSWFVDMPAGESRPARRRWAAWLGDRLPRRPAWAWRYLLAKTFVRSETMGAWCRWHAAAVLAVAEVDNRAADWIVCALALFVGGIQLTEIAGLRFGPSTETLPIPQAGRRTAAASIARVAGAAGVLVIWLATALPQGADMPGYGWAVLAAGLAWSLWVIPRRIARAGLDEDEDEDEDA